MHDALLISPLDAPFDLHSMLLPMPFDAPLDAPLRRSPLLSHHHAISTPSIPERLLSHVSTLSFNFIHHFLFGGLSEGHTFVLSVPTLSSLDSGGKHQRSGISSSLLSAHCIGGFVLLHLLSPRIPCVLQFCACHRLCLFLSVRVQKLPFCCRLVYAHPTHSYRRTALYNVTLVTINPQPRSLACKQ